MRRFIGILVKGILLGLFLIILTIGIVEAFRGSMKAEAVTFVISNGTPTPALSGEQTTTSIRSNGFNIKATPTATPTPTAIPTPKVQHVFINNSVPKYVSVTVPVIKYNEGNANGYLTEPVHIDVDTLTKAYDQSYERQPWDINNRLRTIHVLWNFLVEQQCVSRTIASGIIGNVCMEGTFGREQTTHVIFKDIDDVREVLGKGDKGYGIAQWTWYSRQLNLLKYYEWANSQIDDWNTVMLVAECSMLLEEIKSYKIFSDLSLDYDIEDATGRIASKYEGYRNHEKQWSSSRGVYYLDTTDKSCTGYKRLQYAYNIYEYFLEN